MSRDVIKQRIQYLIEHGGTYPEERRQVPRPLLYMLAAILVLQLVDSAELLRLLLR